jgi:hypothetical protein
VKQFLAIYLGNANSPNYLEWSKLDEATRQERTDAGIKAWYDWGAVHKAAIVVAGAPLGKTKRASATGVSDTKNDMTGYVVVQAESHEAATRMFENHPHFTIFPGEAVEIVECLPIPGRS